MLQHVRYCDEMAKLEMSTILSHYKDVPRMHEFEDAYFQIGKYYDKVMLATLNRHEQCDKAG